jgi:hypothetical protein
VCVCVYVCTLTVACMVWSCRVVDGCQRCSRASIVSYYHDKQSCVMFEDALYWTCGLVPWNLYQFNRFGRHRVGVELGAALKAAVCLAQIWVRLSNCPTLCFYDPPGTPIRGTHTCTRYVHTRYTCAHIRGTHTCTRYEVHMCVHTRYTCAYIRGTHVHTYEVRTCVWPTHVRGTHVHMKVHFIECAHTHMRHAHTKYTHEVCTRVQVNLFNHFVVRLSQSCGATTSCVYSSLCPSLPVTRNHVVHACILLVGTALSEGRRRG